MNDTTKEQNGKNSKIYNVVCITLRLRGSWNLVNLTFNRAYLFYLGDNLNFIFRRYFPYESN